MQQYLFKYINCGILCNLKEIYKLCNSQEEQITVPKFYVNLKDFTCCSITNFYFLQSYGTIDFLIELKKCLEFHHKIQDVPCYIIFFLMFNNYYYEIAFNSIVTRTRFNQAYPKSESSTITVIK